MRKHARAVFSIGAFVILLTPLCYADVSIGELQLVAKQRVSRVVFEFTYHVQLVNDGPAIVGATAEVFSDAPATEIVDGALNFGNIAADSSLVSTNTFSLRQDRRVPFDRDLLNFDLSFERVPPEIQIVEPADRSLVNGASVTVIGTVSDPLTTITVNGATASIAGSNFSIAGIPLTEGMNTIVATAIDRAGSAATSTISVLRDSTSPQITIESPAAGTVTPAESIAVAGAVRDVATGSIGNGTLNVACSGVAALVTNGGFVAFGVPLRPGVNTIDCAVQDETGNSSSAAISIIRRRLAGQRIELVSGNDQSGQVGTELPEPLIARLLSDDGEPVPSRNVRFRVSRGSGGLLAGATEGRELVVKTDVNGRAQVNFRLGTRAGAGNHRVVTSAAGFAGELEVCAVATPGPAAQVIAVAGGEQRGVAGDPLPRPFEALVIGAAGNPVADVPVLFEVLEGGGGFDGNDSVTVKTNAAGRAAATLTLGTAEGVNNNVVQAGTSLAVGSTPLFVASGVKTGLAELTTASGLVLDNTGLPIPGATVSIDDTSLTTTTDEHGVFTLSGVPVGSITLRIDGTSSTRPEMFPTLQFRLVTIAGRDNDVRRAIELPALATANSQSCGGNGVCELTMADVPGLLLSIAPQSVIFPDGSREGLISFSQVDFDKVPMVPPSGSVLMPSWTIQPSGAQFDPAAQVTIPNMQGAKPGEQVDIFQFDQSMEDFVSIGTGTVSEDGSVIATDPGSGITVSGWGGPRPQPSNVTDAASFGEEFAQAGIDEFLARAASTVRIDTIGWIGIIQSSTTFACAAHLDVVDEVHKKVREIGGKSARLCCGSGPPFELTVTRQPCLFRGDPQPLANICDLLEAVEQEFGKCR